MRMRALLLHIGCPWNFSLHYPLLKPSLKALLKMYIQLRDIWITSGEISAFLRHSSNNRTAQAALEATVQLRDNWNTGRCLFSKKIYKWRAVPDILTCIKVVQCLLMKVWAYSQEVWLNKCAEIFNKVHKTLYRSSKRLLELCSAEHLLHRIFGM